MSKRQMLQNRLTLSLHMPRIWWPTFKFSNIFSISTFLAHNVQAQRCIFPGALKNEITRTREQTIKTRLNHIRLRHRGKRFIEHRGQNVCVYEHKWIMLRMVSSSLVGKNAVAFCRNLHLRTEMWCCVKWLAIVHLKHTIYIYMLAATLFVVLLWIRLSRTTHCSCWELVSSITYNTTVAIVSDCNDFGIIIRLSKDNYN